MAHHRKNQIPKQPKLSCAICVAWRVTPRLPGGS